MNTSWDTLANLNLDGSSQVQTAPPPTQSSDPWSSVMGISPDTTPGNVTTAESKLDNQDENGECQKFVEEATYGRSGIFPSAIEAWNNYLENGKAYQGDVTKAPSGTLIYYAPDTNPQSPGYNQGYGHVGISDGKGNMVSATDNGVKISNITQWVQQTGQQPLGYVTP